MHFADELIDRSRTLASPTCVGLDPRTELLPTFLAPETAASPRALARAFESLAAIVFDAVAGVVPAVKIQIAFYEALGLPGVRAYAHTVALAKERGLLVIGDVKRGDIGSTAEAYAQGHFDAPAPAECVDAITLNPYLGSDAIQPFLDRAATQGKGAFVLVRTSNASARQVQDLRCDGDPLYLHVARLVARWGRAHVGRRGYSSLGAVVGATYPDELRTIRAAEPSLLILVPGYGAQGGSAEDVAPAFDAHGSGLLVTSSRDILRAALPADSVRTATALVKAAAERMRDDLRRAFERRTPERA